MGGQAIVAVKIRDCLTHCICLSVKIRREIRLSRRIQEYQVHEDREGHTRKFSPLKQSSIKAFSSVPTRTCSPGEPPLKGDNPNHSIQYFPTGLLIGSLGTHNYPLTFICLLQRCSLGMRYKIRVSESSRNYAENNLCQGAECLCTYNII